MPLFDFICNDCGKTSEVLVFSENEPVNCPHCGGENMTKHMSPTSSLTGRAGGGLPGPGDTACCGSAPGHGGCAGPGSCCGKA